MPGFASLQVGSFAACTRRRAISLIVCTPIIGYRRSHGGEARYLPALRRVFHQLPYDNRPERSRQSDRPSCAVAVTMGEDERGFHTPRGIFTSKMMKGRIEPPYRQGCR